MRCLLGIAAVAASLAGTAFGQDRCDSLTALTSDPVMSDLADRHPGWLTGASCRGENLGAGKTGATCFWEHSYRNGAAEAQFNQMRDWLGACLDSGTTPITDAAVNHPDTYVLEDFIFDEKTVSISLKDKAALGKSFVFFRMR